MPWPLRTLVGQWRVQAAVHHEQVFGAFVVEFVVIAACHQRAGLGLEPVLAVGGDQQAAATSNEQQLIGLAGAPRGAATGHDAQLPKRKELAAVGRIDHVAQRRGVVAGPVLGRVAGMANQPAHGVGLPGATAPAS